MPCRHGKQCTDMAPPMQELHQIAQGLLSNLLRVSVLTQNDSAFVLIAC